MPDTRSPSPVVPADDVKAAHVRRMFSAIAPRYDLLNRTLSLRRDQAWRRRAIDRLSWERAPAGIYLDNCCGTYDLAVELAKRPGFRGRIVGSDFASPMLEEGRAKIAGQPIAPVCADALQLPVPPQTFDGAFVGFGVRNLADLDAGFLEFRRVLKPGARLVVLELSTPVLPPLRTLYLLYFRRILPALGRVVSRHSSAYSYLPESVLRFPEPPELAQRIVHAGFTDVQWEALTAGIAALHWGVRV